MPRGWCITHAHWAIRWARASTCTPRPPVTGMLTLGHRSSIEPEVDLTGHWIDGDLLPRRARSPSATTPPSARAPRCCPARWSARTPTSPPGSAVVGKVKNGQYWKGSPAVKSGKARHPWPDHRPPRAAHWVPVYGLSSLLLGALPLVSLGAGLARAGLGGAGHRDPRRRGAWPPRRGSRWPPWSPLAVYAVLTVVGVRVLSIGLREGYHPVRSRVGWQLWATERLMDAARNYLFPLYASLLTPVWLRMLGREGRPQHRDLDRAGDAEVHRRRGRRVPGRRHHGGVLRTRRRLDPHRHGHRRQAGVPGQLRHHPAGPAGSRRRSGGRAVGHPAEGQDRLVVAGQPADPVAPPRRHRRCRPDLSTRRCG